MPNTSLAVIWDVDGTLVDTAEMHFAAWARTAAELGRPFSRADFTATFGRRNPEIIRYLFHREFSAAEVLAIGERKENLYRAAATDGVQLLPGVKRLLAELSEQGVRQAVGSSAPRANLDLILGATGILKYFAAVVAMEDTQRGKPDPEVFVTAAQRIGVPPERCLVLEDAVAGVQSAKAAGMKCMAITFVGHHSAERLSAAGADRVIATFDEISVNDIVALLP